MDPETTEKRTHDSRIDTAYRGFGPGLLETLPAILEPYFGAGPFLIVSDGRIWAAVGGRLAPFLARYPDTRLLVLPPAPPPYADDSLVARVHEVIASSGAVPIAVGAGTINDVVKRASFETGRRYACVPTAPSVDGYTSYGAAITVRGFKTTLECPAPLCVAADEDVIADAPGELVASGYGDLIAKLTGGADWILADAMGIEPIVRSVWDMVQPSARAVLDRPESIRARDRAAMSTLYDGLAMTGLAMQVYRDSRPASGAEHLLSHTWEMSEPTAALGPSHGFKVAVGTLVSAAIFSSLFSEGGAAGRALAGRGFAPAEELLSRRLEAAAALGDHPARAAAERVVRAKTPGPESLARRANRAREAWGGLGRAIGSQIPDFEALKRALATAGCPVEPADIGLAERECRRSVELASLIRPRYTVLDLASELGVLDLCVEEAFSRRRFSRYAPAGTS